MTGGGPSRPQKTLRRARPRARTGLPLVLLALLLAGVGLYQSRKPLPPGMDYRGPARSVAVGDVDFLADLTYRDSRGTPVHEQEIFDALFAAVSEAKRFILMDMFLFNPFLASRAEPLRNLSGELTDLLVEKTESVPGIRIALITDPINTVYGGDQSEQLERLQASGVDVIFTDLPALRDSNPLYSSPWRVFLQWFGNSPAGGIVPHPFDSDGRGVTVRSYLDMLNFKANHRKVLVADDGAGGLTSIVTSANPHDASSAHSNVALRVRGAPGRDLVAAESAVARFSGSPLPKDLGGGPSPEGPPAEGGARVILLTESRIKEAFLHAIDGSTAGDEIRLAMFYLSDRRIIEALLEAAAGGARVRIVLDPNRDAFGFEKNGVPNRPVARELVRRSGGDIEVRWYETGGEQFHSKVMLVDGADGRSTLILGSANLTRRNLDSYNLELDVQVLSGAGAPPLAEARDWFERIWTNRGGRFTVRFGAFADDSPYKTLLYRFQEFSGLCSF